MRHKSTKLQQSFDPDSIDRMQKMGLAFSLFHYESLLSKVYAGIQGTHRFKSNLDVDEISAYPQRILGENGSLREFYKPACLACTGGSSIIKVPGDVPLERVYFFVLLVWPRVYFLSNLSLDKGMFFSSLG